MLIDFVNIHFYLPNVPSCLQDKHSPEGLKAHLPLVLVEKVSERGRKEFRASRDQQDRQDHKAPQGYQARDCQGCQESQGFLVLKATQELESLACQECQENLEDPDYQDQKVILVLVVVKDRLDFLGLQGSQVPLDCPGFQNQEVRGCPDRQVLWGSPAKKVYLGFLVLLATREIKDLVYLVCQV